MFEAKPTSMQRNTVLLPHEDPLTAVLAVADYRIPAMRELHAYLMLTTCLEFDLQELKTSQLAKYSIRQAGLLTARVARWANAHQPVSFVFA